MKANKQDSDDKMMQLIAFMMDQTNNYKSSPTQKDTSTPPYPTTMVPYNKRDTPLEGGHSIKINGMWALKHDISSPEFYDLLINTELKGDTAMDIKYFYKHIKTCLNGLTRI